MLAPDPKQGGQRNSRLTKNEAHDLHQSSSLHPNVAGKKSENNWPFTGTSSESEPENRVDQSNSRIGECKLAILNVSILFYVSNCYSKSVGGQSLSKCKTSDNTHNRSITTVQAAAHNSRLESNDPHDLQQSSSLQPNVRLRKERLEKKEDSKRKKKEMSRKTCH